MNARRLIRCVPAFGLALGCSHSVVLPTGHLPMATGTPDQAAADTPAPKPSIVQPPRPKGAFDLPPGLPGADAAPLTPLKFPANTPIAERNAAVQAAYPKVTPVSATEPAVDAAPLTLADLQKIAMDNNPALRRAAADADAAYGTVIQSKLYPNPTVGYEGDTAEPGLKPSGNAGQQGGYITQVIKTAGKLSLAEAVAGFDYLNATVALRRAQLDIASQVRTNYFNVLVAKEGIEVNKALIELADDVYQRQLKLVAAGEAAGYEPLQLHAQAEQARTALALSEANYRSAWKQLAASLGKPDMPLTPLAGRADTPCPQVDAAMIQARMLDQHTDLLAAKNTLLQAQTNLKLQNKIPIPDIQTYTYYQRDTVNRVFDFGVQVGVTLPLWDRNQGNIHNATATINKAAENVKATENDLIGKLAEALGRYEANRITADRYREKILPDLAQAYRALVRRWNVDAPGTVGYNDIVTAQQNLAQALQSYLTALAGQWQAAVDIASLGQFDEIYPVTPTP